MQTLNRQLNFKSKESSLRTLVCGLLCFLGLVGASIGQTTTNQKEQVTFHTPKTLYFSGEKIWFEAKVSLGEQLTSSQVLYAELVDRNSNSITNIKVPLQAGVALNFVPVSDQIPSDQYLLRVYTRISPYLDLNQGIAQQLITIINPKIPPREVASILPKGSCCQLWFFQHGRRTGCGFGSFHCQSIFSGRTKAVAICRSV
jgi:hypothetical protein